jgi:hypothetical protein
MMQCPICPAWMGGGMLIATVIGVLVTILVLVLIARLVWR